MDWIYANLYSCHKIIPPQRNKYKKDWVKNEGYPLGFSQCTISEEELIKALVQKVKKKLNKFYKVCTTSGLLLFRFCAMLCK